MGALVWTLKQVRPHGRGTISIGLSPLGNLCLVTRGENVQHQGDKEWAYRLQDKEAAGIPLSKLQQQYWREALNKRKEDPAVRRPRTPNQIVL